jgi:hypothetical protein
MKLLFAGDVALGDHPKTIGFGFYSRYKNGIPVIKAQKLFPDGLKADVTFGNLEFNLGSEMIDGDSPAQVQCRGLKRFVPFLTSAGFNVLNIANNHMYEQGIVPFENTLHGLRDAGIKVCGTSDDFSEERILRIGDESALVVGFCDRPRQAFKDSPPYNEIGNVDLTLHKIRKLKSFVDILCVSLHWGDEFIQIPSERERSFARKLIECGANIVIGHHPHVLREIEEFKGGLIAYSLGNFMCDMLWNKRTKESGCLYVEYGKNGLGCWKFHPAIVGDDFFPVYLEGSMESDFMADLASRFISLHRSLSSSSYISLARREMLRHQVMTALFLLRNIYRFRPNILLKIVKAGFLSRLGIESE